MFCDRTHHGHHAMGLLMLVSIAATIPFYCYMRRMADSLEVIAKKQ